ncbi:putative transcription factor ARF family [Helianthus debilis subsp. tardiflorus]
MSKVEMRVDPRFWHACAGGMIQIPFLNSTVYYFPQGHAEHTHTNVDFRRIPFPTIPPCILCKVIDVKLMAHKDLEEIYAKITLCPLENSIEGYNVNGGCTVSDFTDKLSYFAKTLTDSDVDSGDLIVPNDVAETIFPKLDCSTAYPVQTVIAKDIHGKSWKFRHAYLGIPRKHVLTTGWNAFVIRKLLVEGCSVVFMRAENGDLCVGIRRPKLMKKGRNVKFSGRGLQVRADDVIQAASLALKGQAFEITYYPQAGTPEFVVKASYVDTATRVQWRDGMRFKMAFETEGLSRKSWFMGRVSSVQDVDPLLWPKSPWRCLQVKWDDEQDLLQKVKRVSPWVVKLVSNMPSIHIPASIQGARRDHLQTPLRDLDPTHILELSLFPKHLDESRETIDLTIGRSSNNLKKNDDKPILQLFGRSIDTDEQVNHSSDEKANEVNAVKKDSRILMTNAGYVLKSLRPCEELYELAFL